MRRHCSTLKTVGHFSIPMGDGAQLRDPDLGDSEIHGKFFTAFYGWVLLDAAPVRYGLFF